MFITYFHFHVQLQLFSHFSKCYCNKKLIWFVLPNELSQQLMTINLGGNYYFKSEHTPNYINTYLFSETKSFFQTHSKYDKHIKNNPVESSTKDQDIYCQVNTNQ